LKSETRQVSLWDHRNFKYLIDCPGIGYSGRLKWLLASGRPVFIVERKIVEYWLESLQPWVHFIPVKEDLSDLMEAWRKVEMDPVLYRSISEAAKRFAKDNLLLDVQIRKIAEAAAAISND
jgi:hypothetical protein